MKNSDSPATKKDLADLEVKLDASFNKDQLSLETHRGPGTR